MSLEERTRTAMLRFAGEKCKDYDPECFACQSWRVIPAWIESEQPQLIREVLEYVRPQSTPTSHSEWNEGYNYALAQFEAKVRSLELEPLRSKIGPSTADQMEENVVSSVASLELCRELYNLTGWEMYGNEVHYTITENPRRGVERKYALSQRRESDYDIPAYDVPYIFDQLEGLDPQLSSNYDGWLMTAIGGQATDDENPANAAVSLAIALVKGGVLEGKV